MRINAKYKNCLAIIALLGFSVLCLFLLGLLLAVPIGIFENFILSLISETYDPCYDSDIIIFECGAYGIASYILLSIIMVVCCVMIIILIYFVAIIIQKIIIKIRRNSYDEMNGSTDHVGPVGPVGEQGEIIV